MLAGLKSYLFPTRIRSRAQLTRFVSGEASYVAQRSTYEFSRNTLAWFGQSAFGDPAFNDAFAVCRWEAFAAIAADMAFVVRSFLDGGPELDPALVRTYADALGEYPAPVHRPEGWSDRHAALLSRFAGVSSDHRPDLKVMGHRTGALIHEFVPARSKNAEEERQVLAAAVTFGLISFNDRLPKRLDRNALLANLRLAS
ncbi:hypothetical protein KQ910_26250 [Reyranella sp. MMS21-HV4-11]|jgi:hypothetical protein|uniref:Uncharacterized protein n=1 Tax=Reyranella humidisoli TaxID=2849149 RepID=A0ABS6IRS7_9HYPH|nr:hypothetical protein [Reyranella sp. MMS21-HV4-11]MBU8877297.1 hypothetical protein [Reyranella sp. MMS21-HV4-11]